MKYIKCDLEKNPAVLLIKNYWIVPHVKLQYVKGVSEIKGTYNKL